MQKKFQRWDRVYEAFISTNLTERDNDMNSDWWIWKNNWIKWIYIYIYIYIYMIKGSTLF